MPELFAFYWRFATIIVVAAVAIVLAATVILYKRNENAAIAWVGLILLSPVMGSITYLLFGINRIRRRAARTRAPSTVRMHRDGVLDQRVGAEAPLDRLIDSFAINSAVAGNRVELLRNGDATYPAMIAAIDAATRSVALSTYIFKRDTVGLAFVDALSRAKVRGVEVRVLIDGVGQAYSLPTIAGALRDAGIPFARYMHSFLPWRMPYLNLRSHRKVMVVDGIVGFTGGINISHNNRVADNPNRAVRDLHFRIDGPLVGQLSDAFADDWNFTAGENLQGPRWFPELASRGDVIARAIPTGPHEPIDRTRWILHAAILEARKRVSILTPYFLPDEILHSALRIASIKGVAVDIVIPERSNLRFVDWAVRARLDELLTDGCRVLLGPAPFNHAKLFLVDEEWALIGSSNWDPRSLRLNFELNVECRSVALLNELSEEFDDECRRARELTVDELKRRPLAVRLRDGMARLFSPYL
ncbi:MAG: cardiolipin synthase [Alphaproteobacteria bacterium]|nr:cardiolipin synthase [Alphaproteobacteria bacterium]HCP01637.1 cardiolipin synthase [Rhodospirillaceae bacterium]